MKGIKLAAMPKLGGITAPLKAPSAVAPPKQPSSAQGALKAPKAPSISSSAAGIFKQKMASSKGLGNTFTSAKPLVGSKSTMGLNRLPRVPHSSNI